MKKLIMALLIALALMCLMGTALAGGQTNTRWNEIKETREWAGGVRNRAYAQVTIKCVRTPTLTDPGQFTVSVDRDPSNYLFSYVVLDRDHDNALVYQSIKTSDRTFNGIQLYYTGHYGFFVYLYNKSTRSIDDMDGIEVSVEGPATASLEYQAQRIVQQCLAEDDWHTALNLHDYLTTHAYYDLDMEYYGPDIMLRGYGVCEGYTRAYMMLCEMAGIEAKKLESDIMNHTWNIIRIDGTWYQVDVTWDDPSGGTDAESGAEGHYYFCMSDQLMFEYGGHELSDCVYYVLDTFPLPEYVPICDGLDAYYEVHENEWQSYGRNALIEDPNGTYWIDDTCYAYVNDLQTAFEAGFSRGETAVTVVWPYHFDFELDEGVAQYSEIGERDRIVYIWGLGHRTFRLGDGRLVTVTADESGYTITLTVTGEISPIDDPDLRVLVLPADLTTIESQAFAGLSEADAIRIPAGVTSIASDAFDQDILLFVPEGSAWVQWAEDYGDTCYTY
ncbi:MAG: hypothetical protein IJJ23_00875 [Clostridia bacterium]|nr:hypothetical protein [Clostridia bacterium]